jgi:hypothetical protein
MSECKCNLRTRLVGDGCERCNPQMAIDILKERLDELRSAADQADEEYRAEIARLRLTDAERSAIRDAADRYASITPESAATAATLRGLLERTGSV